MSTDISIKKPETYYRALKNIENGRLFRYPAGIGCYMKMAGMHSGSRDRCAIGVICLNSGNIYYVDKNKEVVIVPDNTSVTLSQHPTTLR